MSGQVDELTNKSQNWREMVNTFTQNTTVHGVRYLYDISSPSICRRLIWLVIFFTSAGFFVNQVVKSVIHFKERPMTVKVEVNFNDSLRFPGVVLCNQNAFRVTEAERNDFKPILDEYYGANSTKEKLDVLVKYEMDEQSLRELMVLTRHRSDDMIVRCQWRNEECGFWNFSTIITDHGVCYSFNMDEEKEPLYMNESGRSTALQLTLNIEQYENMIGPHFAAGVKLLLCDEKDIGIFQGHGQGLAAGKHTFVGTKVVVVKRLTPNCTNEAALDFYPYYSERACYVECFSKFFIENAECQAPYMKSPDTPFCNFYEYTMFHADLKDQFHDNRDKLCDCKLPCQSTTYKSTFSYLKASEFDIEKILPNSRDLQKKHAKARDALQTTKAEDWKKDEILLAPFRNLMDKTELLILEEIGQMLVRNRREAQELLRQTTEAYETVKDTIDFQSFVVNKNFYRYVIAKDQLRISVISDKYLDFLARYSKSIELMTSLTGTGSENETRRAAILDSLTTELNAKALQLESIFRIIVYCKNVYRKARPQFLEYQYKNMDAHARDLIIPHALLRKTVTQTDFLPNPDYAMPYVVSNLNQTIHRLRKIYNRFKRFLREAYNSGTLDEKKMKHIGSDYIQTIAHFNSNRSIMMNDIFKSPIDKMAKREEVISSLWQTVKDSFGQVMQYLDSLDSTWRQTVLETWPNIENLKSKTEEYSKEFEITARLIGKSELAKAFVDPDTQDAVKALMEFNDNIMIGIPNVIGSWHSIHTQFADKLLREKVAKDRFLKKYLKAHHPELTSMKKFPNSSLAATVTRLKEKTAEWSNFSEVIQDTIKPFHEAFLAVLANVEIYMKDNEIGVKFYTDNYLSLSIYFEDLNYELIEQQEAYTLTALLSDIGGSMGLFVGGSVLSVFELLDVFLYNGLVQAKAGKKRRRQQSLQQHEQLQQPLQQQLQQE